MHSVDFSDKGGTGMTMEMWENNNLQRLFKCEQCDKAFTQGNDSS